MNTRLLPNTSIKITRFGWLAWILLVAAFPAEATLRDPDDATAGEVLALVQPLIEQGRKHYFLQEYGSAIEKLRHAQVLMHSEAGVNTELQLNLIHWLALCYLVTGQIEEADRQLHLHLLVSRHVYGTSGYVTLESLLQLADWHLAISETDTARELYEQARSVYELHREHFLSEHLFRGEDATRKVMDKYHINRQALIHEHFLDWLNYFYHVPIEQCLEPQTGAELPVMERVILSPNLTQP